MTVLATRKVSYPTCGTARSSFGSNDTSRIKADVRRTLCIPIIVTITGRAFSEYGFVARDICA